VVRLGPERSFVIADVPGLIAGAAGGHGLGIQFLRHVERTRLLLHLVDLAPLEGFDPQVVHTIERELTAHNPRLATRERWLVFSKADLMPAEDAVARARDATTALNWRGRWFVVSSARRDGLGELLTAVDAWLTANADPNGA
jgi:GTP-binding protein